MLKKCFEIFFYRNIFFCISDISSVLDLDRQLMSYSKYKHENGITRHAICGCFPADAVILS